jgi:hypothetical protein
VLIDVGLFSAYYTDIIGYRMVIYVSYTNFLWNSTPVATLSLEPTSSAHHEAFSRKRRHEFVASQL